MGQAQWLWTDNATGTGSGTSNTNTFTVSTVTGTFPTPTSSQQFAIAVAIGTSFAERAVVTNNASGVFTLASPLTYTHSNVSVALILVAAALDTFDQIINILEYGADPSGSSDSAPAINSAISACGETGGQSAVFVPTGSFLCDSQLLFSANNVGMIGASPSGPGQGLLAPTGASVLFGSTSLAVPLICFQPPTGVNLWNGFLKNLRIVGHNTSPAAGANYTTGGFATSTTSGNVGVQRFGCTAGGVWDCTIGGFAQGLNTDLHPDNSGVGSSWNSYKRLRIDTGAFSSGTQWAVGAGAALSGMTANDTFANRYEDISTVLAGASGSVQYGYHIGTCDSEIFDHASVAVSGSGGSYYFAAFNYSLNPGDSTKFPADVEFRHSNLKTNTLTSTTFNIGTVGANAKPNRILYPIWENGVPSAFNPLGIWQDNLLAPWSEPTASGGGNSLAALATGSAITIPASATPFQNPNIYQCFVAVTANSSGAVTVSVAGSGAMNVAAGTTCMFRLPYAAFITLTYTSAPTWHWFYGGMAP